MLRSRSSVDVTKLHNFVLWKFSLWAIYNIHKILPSLRVGSDSLADI